MISQTSKRGTWAAAANAATWEQNDELHNLPESYWDQRIARMKKAIRRRNNAAKNPVGRDSIRKMLKREKRVQ